MEGNRGYYSFDGEQKLIIKVRQHTPLIHFQGGQDNAFLRATELKPKLDAFMDKILRKKYEGNEKELDGLKLKKNGEKGAHDSYDYKVMINTGNKAVKSFTIEKFPPFFGDTGKEENEKKQFVFCAETFEVNFFSFKKPLLDCIKDCFPGFLFQTNFGSRQSKGFGSFYVETDIKESEHDYSSFFEVIVNKAKGKNDDVEISDYKYLFEAIDRLYKTFRGGINYKDIYFKSLMYHYAIKKGFSWEKKYMKEEFSNLVRDNRNNKNSPCYASTDAVVAGNADKYRLYRDMLGLSSEQSWGGVRVKKEDENKDDQIERFKSPIIFKPILVKESEKPGHSSNIYRVYILLESIDEKMFSRKFCISVANNKKKALILTPSEEEFDLNEFFKFCVRFVNDDAKFLNISCDNIKSIYAQLKNNFTKSERCE